MTVLAVIKLSHYRSSKKKTISWISVTFLLVTKKVLVLWNMISDCKEGKSLEVKLVSQTTTLFLWACAEALQRPRWVGQMLKHLLCVCWRQQCARHFQSKTVVMLEWEKTNHCRLAEKIIVFSINLSYCLHIVIGEMIGTNPYSYSRSITRLTLTPTGQLRNSSHK